MTDPATAPERRLRPDIGGNTAGCSGNTPPGPTVRVGDRIRTTVTSRDGTRYWCCDSLVVKADGAEFTAREIPGTRRWERRHPDCRSCGRPIIEGCRRCTNCICRFLDDPRNANWPNRYPGLSDNTP